MIWWYVAAFVVALVVATALAPKPQSQPPAGLGDITPLFSGRGLDVTKPCGRL